MKVTNIKPVELSPVYKASANGAFEPNKLLQETMAKPLFNPLIQGQPCVISENGKNLTDDDVADIILACMGDQINTQAEDLAKELMSKCLLTFNRNATIGAKGIFVTQAGTAAGLPEPGPRVKYTPAQDVVPISKEFLNGKCDYNKYFATMAYYTRVNTLGFYFANKVAFDDFKVWLNTQLQNLSSALPAQTNQMFIDFMQLTLDGLTESLVLRKDDTDNNDPFSFARTLVSLLMNYTSVIGPALYGVMPFDVGELFCPQTVVFINVEAHMQASSKQINDEWDIIQKSIANKPTMVSINKLQNLTATMRSLQKFQAAANMYQAMGQGGGAQKAAMIRFKKSPPTKVDVTKFIMAILKKLGTVNRSENSYKQVKMSFARPNRRDPDDFNRMGKIVSTKYMPDIHVYIDTSGSISEENYEDAIRSCIRIARKLNVNLYFNSFSHVLSQCAKINTKDRTVGDCYRAFQKIPKVTGGTNFEQIWHYINRSPKRQRELSIIITDFEWTAGNYYVKHPDRLYYMPCSQMSWNRMVRNAQDFAKSMLHNDPGIMKHIFA